MSKPILDLLAWYAEQGFTQSLKEPPFRADHEPFSAFPNDENPPPAPPQSSKAEALRALKQELMAFEGCALKRSAQSTVFGDGNVNARLMLVGEAPGAQEDQQGLPFVGMSGQLLQIMLESIGLKRKDVYITNMVPWRPPFNRQPTPQEVESCRCFIERHIGLIGPKILVCVGSTALKGLLTIKTSITHAQDQSLSYVNPYLDAPIPTYALFHPAYLLRAPGQKKQAWHQLLKIKKHMCD